MTKILPVHARLMLREACGRYVFHNEQKMGDLLVVSPVEPEEFYYSDALNRDYPMPGFGDWFACKIFDFAETIHLLHARSSEFMSRLMDAIQLDQMPINWETEQRRISNLSFEEQELARYSGEPDQSHPAVVLHNLSSLITILVVVLTHDNFILRLPDFDSQLEEYKTNHPNHTSYLISDNDSISVKIYKTMYKLKFLIRFAEGLPDLQRKKENISYLNRQMTEIEPVIEDYLKGVVAKELLATLDSSLTDEQSISAVESQLNNNFTMEILSKNHQSKSEQNLKLLSVISILIGVGIFTTLGLVFKRLYDTGGTSINFFKPLSKNFQEEITDVTSSVALGS